MRVDPHNRASNWGSLFEPRRAALLLIEEMVLEVTSDRSLDILASGLSLRVAEDWVGLVVEQRRLRRNAPE